MKTALVLITPLVLTLATPQIVSAQTSLQKKSPEELRRAISNADQRDSEDVGYSHAIGKLDNLSHHFISLQSLAKANEGLLRTAGTILGTNPTNHPLALEMLRNKNIETEARNKNEQVAFLRRKLNLEIGKYKTSLNQVVTAKEKLQAADNKAREWDAALQTARALPPSDPTRTSKIQAAEAGRRQAQTEIIKAETAANDALNQNFNLRTFIHEYIQNIRTPSDLSQQPRTLMDSYSQIKYYRDEILANLPKLNFFFDRAQGDLYKSSIAVALQSAQTNLQIVAIQEHIKFLPSNNRLNTQKPNLEDMLHAAQSTAMALNTQAEVHKNLLQEMQITRKATQDAIAADKRAGDSLGTAQTRLGNAIARHQDALALPKSNKNRASLIQATATAITNAQNDLNKAKEAAQIARNRLDTHSRAFNSLVSRIQTAVDGISYIPPVPDRMSELHWATRSGSPTDRIYKPIVPLSAPTSSSAPHRVSIPTTPAPDTRVGVPQPPTPNTPASPVRASDLLQ